MHDVNAPVPLNPALVLAVVPDAQFAARWQTWQQRGAAREQSTRNRLRTAVPFLIAATAMALYTLAR